MTARQGSYCVAWGALPWLRYKVSAERWHPCADWSEGESLSESLSDKPESDVLYCFATSEPRVVGALIMGIDGDRWPRRRCKVHTHDLCSSHTS